MSKTAAPTRRRFIRRTLEAASATLAAGRAVRAAARPAGVLGANDRIRLGVIGCGSLGQNHHIPKLLELSRDRELNVELAAVCDIYEPRKQKAREMSGAELFHDYRAMLDRPDIHGVIIVTPDHWHARMTLDAMEAGKDVHVEKPMTLRWEEAREVYRASQRLKRVVQVGAEGTSRDVFWQANRLIRDGKLGKVVWATAGVYRNVPQGDWNYRIEPECTPRTLDWDAFLGPAPKRPFDPERFFRFRKYWDYSGGVATDLIAHVLSSLQVAIGPEFPRRVSAAGGLYVRDDRETPDTFSMQVEYPSGYMATLFCTQTTESGVEMAVRGTHATLTFGGRERRNQVIVTPERAYQRDAAEIVVSAEPRDDHDVNFIKCMRTRAEPHCPPKMGYQVMVALDLANRSWREGKMYTFDAAKEEAA
jgi:predicted dehydrogenase